MKIRKYLLGVAAVGLAGLTAFAAIRAGGGPPPSPAVVAYTTPTCGCCGKWVTHLRRNGFQVTVHSVGDLNPVRSKLDVPRDLLSCHTAVVDGYIVEGHIPAEDIRRLLEERPQGRGIAVPGMPIGSPGMEHGNRRDPYAVILYGKDGARTVFATH